MPNDVLMHIIAGDQALAVQPIALNPGEILNPHHAAEIIYGFPLPYDFVARRIHIPGAHLFYIRHARRRLHSQYLHPLPGAPQW
jgi:hypothetical protein